MFNDTYIVKWKYNVIQSSTWYDARRQMPDVRYQMSDVRCQMSDARNEIANKPIIFIIFISFITLRALKMPAMKYFINL